MPKESERTKLMKENFMRTAMDSDPEKVHRRQY